MKWFLILLFIIQIYPQQQKKVVVEDYERCKQKLDNGDTLIFNNIRKEYYLILALLLTTSSNAQVLMSDKGYNPPADIYPPSIPGGLNGVAISDDSLLFYWNHSPENDLNRYVAWFMGAVKDSTSNDSIYIGGLTPNTTYGLRVLSVDNNGNRSAYSDSIQRTTLDTVTALTKPAIPTTLTVTDTVDGIDLSWTPNPPNATNFVIMKNGADYDTVAYPISTYSDADTIDGVFHTYKLYAYNAGGESDTTATVTAERVSSNTYYVSTSGSDAGTGTNPNTAWQTLSKLQGFISSTWSLAGYKIKFKCGDTWTTRGNTGTYGSGLSLVGLQGTSDNWIVFTSYGTGNKPRFDFTGFGDVFQLKRLSTATSAQYIRFEGLSIYPSGTYSNYNLPRYAFGCGSGQDIAGISDIEVRNCYIKNVGGGINLQSDGADIFNIVLVQDTIIETFGGTYFTGYDGMGCAVSFQAADGYRDYDIRIDSCHFENIPNHANAGVHDHAIYTHNNSREYLIRYNTVKDTSPSDTLNTDGFAIAGGAQMTISNNTFDGEIFVGIGLSAQQKNSGTQDSIDVYNNVIGNGVVYGIKIYQLSAYTGTILNYLNIYNNKIYDIDEAALYFENRAKLTNSLIANNTIVDWTSSAVTFYAFPASGSTGNYFYNNIFTNATNTAPYYRGANVRTIDIDDIFAGLDYNVYYRISGTSFWKRYDVSWNYLDEITSFATWKSETNKDANSISGSNPLFVDIGAYDLHLQSGSPAKDVGTTVSKVTTDFEGDSRPYNTVYDIGYDEYEP